MRTSDPQYTLRVKFYTFNQSKYLPKHVLEKTFYQIMAKMKPEIHIYYDQSLSLQISQQLYEKAYKFPVFRSERMGLKSVHLQYDKVFTYVCYLSYEIQIMNSFINITREDLLARLKMAKNNIMKDETDVRHSINSYFAQLREITNNCEHEIASTLNTSILNYHQKLAEISKSLSRARGTLNQDQVQSARQLLESKLGSSPIVPITKLQELIKNSFKVMISEQSAANPSHLRLLSELQQTQSVMSETNNLFQATIEKLQCQRDYFQKREIQLSQRLKQLEGPSARKIVNIKQMSKSYLQEKCSKWAMERLKEQNRILVEKIGSASQEIITLNQTIANLNEELRKMGQPNSECKSFVGGTTNKTNSICVQSDNSKRQRVIEVQEIGKQRELELQLKNQQLLIQITKCMSNIQEQAENIKSLQIKQQELQARVSQKQKQVEDLRQSYQLLNHDYELSLKRKAAFEQQNREIKSQLVQIKNSLVEQRQNYKSLVAQFQGKESEIVRKVKDIESHKKEQISKLNDKLKYFEGEKQKMMKIIEEHSNKKGEELNYKTLLHEQIAKLRKDNSMLDQELQLKEQNLYTAKQQEGKLIKQLKQSQSKTQNSKKELSKLKKQIKDQQKTINQLQQNIELQHSLEIKVRSLQQTMSILQSQFMKYKESTDRKTLVNQKMLSHLKQKFAVQLNSLLSQDLKQKMKKSNQNKLDIIDKYIQEMVTLSSKTAQIKQLKEEINELKQGKEMKSLTKKTKPSSINDQVCSVQSGIFNLSTKIMEQRLAAEKQLYEAKISQLNEQIAKQIQIRNQMQQQYQKQKLNAQQTKIKQKQQIKQDQKAKSTKVLEDKIQKLESQLKTARLNNRKLQNENNEFESEIRIKKELIAGLKKESKDKEQSIKEMSNELSLIKEELQKSKRYNKQAVKKQTLLKDIKEKKGNMEEENMSLKKTVEVLEDKIKSLNKQVSKKDELLKQMKDLQDRQIRMKEQGRIKEAIQVIDEQKQTIRKLRCDVDRKEEIIKNLKQKTESKQRQNDEYLNQKEKLVQKLSKEIESYQRKLESQKLQSKKEENRNYHLVIVIKKIFQLLVSYQKDDLKVTKMRQSTHYYSGSSVSPHQLKFTSPTSQLKNIDICQGLKILDLRPEDIEGIMAQTSVLSRVTNNEQSWSMVSPILTKNDQRYREQYLLQGLQQLQRLLSLKQPKNGQILQLFRKALKIE